MGYQNNRNKGRGGRGKSDASNNNDQGSSVGYNFTGKNRELRAPVDASEDFRAATPAQAAAKPVEKKIHHLVEIESAAKIDLLCGKDNVYLKTLEMDTGAEIDVHEKGLALVGTRDQVNHTMKKLFERLATLNDTSGVSAEVFHQIVQEANAANENAITIHTPLLDFETLNPNQAKWVRAVPGHDYNFGVGPAGTGKTYLAVGVGVEALERGEFKRLLLCRPILPAGKDPGALPGDMGQKIAPYLRPLYDCLNEMLGKATVDRYIEQGKIEIAPMEFMRGRTLKDSFIIVDEVQNTTLEHMRMILTRLGDGSKMTLTGDITQSDLPIDPKTGLQQRSGLDHFVTMIGNTTKDKARIGVTLFDSFDVVRHPAVAQVVELYEEDAAREKELALAKISASAAPVAKPADQYKTSENGTIAGQAAIFRQEGLAP